MTQAEAHPTELPNRVPGRAARIAALHMMADWFAAHPEVPVPSYVVANYWVDAEDEPAQEVRVRDVTSVATALDATLYPSDNAGDPERQWQFDHILAAPSVHGIEIIYRASYHPNRKSGNW
jgi:hypothetical protein